MSADDLAGILLEHGQLGMVRQGDGSFLWECICGEKLPEDPELVEDAHYAHQAAVIAAAGWKWVDDKDA